MIAVPIAQILKGLKATKGKSGEQIEVEAKAHEMLLAFRSKEITLQELEKLMEEAGLEIALRKMAEKMRPQLKDSQLKVLA